MNDLVQITGRIQNVPVLLTPYNRKRVTCLPILDVRQRYFIANELDHPVGTGFTQGAGVHPPAGWHVALSAPWVAHTKHPLEQPCHPSGLVPLSKILYSILPDPEIPQEMATKKHPFPSLPGLQMPSAHHRVTHRTPPSLTLEALAQLALFRMQHYNKYAFA